MQLPIVQQGSAPQTTWSSDSNNMHDDSLRGSTAIIGIGCRLPGDISNTSQLWDLLAQERSAQCKLPKSRFNIDSYHGAKDEPSTTRALGGYFLQEDVRNFDNQFFGINNREASEIDPQQRKLLEVVYESFENAGVTLEDVSGASVGCYVASFTPDFIAMKSKDVESLTRYSQLGMGTTILANRISHIFNMKGPSCVVDTACSSSFYALHMACLALQNGDCESAVVAGVNLIQAPELHVAISQAGVISPSSTCRTFDASADGYGRADGVNAIYIKRLEDAIRDGDPIRSIIRSTAVNSNGRTPGITQPSVDGQAAVIQKCYERAGLHPSNTAYVETHGTGTAVGDPLETEALSRVFRKDHRESATLIGSVKTNLGHGEASSGLTSIIKATLSLEQGQIPATIGLNQLNSKIKAEEWGVEVVTKMIDFPSTTSLDTPRRISINSFGYGGANAHGILEEAGIYSRKSFLRRTLQHNRGNLNGHVNGNGLTTNDVSNGVSNGHHSNGVSNGHSNGNGSITNGSSNGHSDENQTAHLPYILALSAKKLPSLQARVEQLSQTDLSNVSIEDLSYTLGQRRSHLSTRGYIIARQDSLSQDINPDNLRISSTDNNIANSKLCFVFTGQGAQWKGMARELLPFPVFADTIRQMDRELATIAQGPQWKIYDILVDNSADDRINKAEFAQPITTAVQIGVVNLLRSWSIFPHGVVGHSSGEIAAAYTAGHLSVRDAIISAYYRGYIVNQSKSTGAMAAVGLGELEASEWIKKLELETKVKVACINSPQSVTLSGDEDGVDIILAALQAEGTFARKLKTDGKAYHSHHMAAIGSSYQQLLEDDFSASGAAPEESSQHVKMFSTVTRQEVPGKMLRLPTYWRTNLESPVHFSTGLTGLSELIEDHVFIEVGPHAALKLPITQTLGKSIPYFSTLNRNQDSAVSLLNLVGDLFVREYKVDFAKINSTYALNLPAPKTLCDLPTYPWHYEELLWNESRVSRETRNRKYPRHELLGSSVPGGNQSTFSWRNILHLDNVPWLNDHKLGDTVVFPATGYLTTAIEAFLQVSTPDIDFSSKRVELRHVDLLNALPLTSQESIELYTELRPLSISNAANSKDWWEFQISSIADDVATLRAKGSIRLQPVDPVHKMLLPAEDCHVSQQSKRLWYESILNSGIGFGPTFQHMNEIFTPDARGTLYAEAKTPAQAPAIEGAQPNPRYLVHPTLLDSLFQVGLISCTGGDIHSMVARVPTRIGYARVGLLTNYSAENKICCKSEVTGLNFIRLNSAMFDANQQPIAHFQDVDITTYIGTKNLEPRHPFLRLSWKPDIDKIQDDISFTSALDYILSTSELESLGAQAYFLAALDLIVHKNPNLNILCLSTDLTLITFAFLEVLQASTSHRRFHSFSLGRLGSSGDIEIADVRNHTTPLGLKSLSYRKVSSDDDFELVLVGQDLSLLSKLDSKTTTQKTIFLNPGVVDKWQELENLTTVVSQSDKAQNIQLHRPKSILNGTDYSTFTNAILVSNSPIRPAEESLCQNLSKDLGIPFKQVALTDIAESSIIANSLVVSTVEWEKPVLAGVGEKQFDSIKKIIEEAPRIVWVSGSGIHKGCDPTLSLFSGLARAIMIEQPSTKIFSLELDPSADPVDVSRNISQMLAQAQNEVVDYEYIKSDSGLLISRAIPDEALNTRFQRCNDQIPARLTLANAGNAALSTEKPGQLSTTRFIKRPFPNPSKIGADKVVVKVSCIGLNAKDVYALAGRVQTNEGTRSLEYTGEVIAVGSDVQNLNAGDKVAVMYPGHFATYETVPAWSCVRLVDGEDLRSMASVLVVFVTGIYALHYRAQLQPGESILIHSAAGGVGIATIQLAKLIGAEIFATVGTQEKKQYLIDNFGLEADHIFNSRDSSFVSSIKSMTKGRGVDVILNSLVGDLLHESWECLADFGRFVEIGKRDIIDGGRLNMEKFSRSATYTAFDLSMLADSTSPAHHKLYQTMVTRVMKLLRSGEVKPVTPLSIFNVSDVTSALNYFSSSKRLGKIVVSFEDQTQIVPVVPEKFTTQLDPNKTYLLVGCLGGLGRSVSKWMTSRGARRFVFIGRSGADKPAARRLIDDLEQEGAQCIIVRGDVRNYDDAKRAITAAETTLGGVVQAAMGLNEAIFKYMTRDYWLNGTDAKVQGTWNLHNALSELNKEKELDFFVMTSSISGKVGTATESNYCAANNFLDVFARYRVSLGLKAISLGLGMISEVGYLHENPQIEDLLLRKGVRPILEDELLQIFDSGLSQQTISAYPHDPLSLPHILTGLEVTGLQSHNQQGYEGYWHYLNDARFSVLTNSLKRSVSGEASEKSSSQASAISEAVASKDETQLFAAVQTAITSKLSNLILLPAHKLDVKTSLSDFGMDSMLAAELRQYIFGATTVDIPFLELMDKKATVLNLTKTVTEKLFQESS